MGGVGFSDSEIYNKTLLVSYVWRIPSFIYKVYEVKYGFLEISLFKGELKKGSRSLAGWRSISIGTEFIRLKAGIWIGDRKSVNIFGDRWVGEEESSSKSSDNMRKRVD